MDETGTGEDNKSDFNSDDSTTPDSNEQSEGTFTANDDKGVKDRPSFFDFAVDMPLDALRREGYFLAVEHPSYPYERYQNFIALHTNRENELVAETSANAEIEIERYKERIKAAGEQRDAIVAEIAAYKQEVEHRLPEKQDLVQLLDKVKAQIYNFFSDLSEAKKTVLERRINEVNNSLQQLIEGQRRILDNEKLPFINYLGRGQKLAQDIINRYDILSNDVANRLKEIQQVMHCFDMKGMSPVILNFLMSTGFMAAVVAGWFFANFTQLSEGGDKKEWLNSGFVSNLITAALNFVKTHNKWHCLYYLGIFIGLVTILSGLSDVCKWIYRQWLTARMRKLGQVKGNSSFEFKAGLSELEGVPFSLEINSETMFIFWLEILPLVFIAGVIIIILSYNDTMFAATAPVGSVAGQLVSFTSEVAGFLMSISLGAIYYLYFTHKGKQLCDEENTPAGYRKSWFSRNWEVALLIGFIGLVNLIVLILLAIISIWDYGLNPHALGAITLAQFLLYANVAGLCIGFGIFGKGLISNAGWLEFKLDATSAKVKYYYQNSLSLFFTNDFDTKYKYIQEEILDLLGRRLNPAWSTTEKNNSKARKTKAAVEAALAAHGEKQRNFYERFLKRLNTMWLSVAGQQPAALVAPPVTDTALSWDMSEEDIAFYPELATELEGYNKQRKDIEMRLNEIKIAYDGFYEKSSIRYIKLNDGLRVIDLRIENWYWRIRQIRDNLPVRIKLIRNQAIQERTAVQDGYDLGMWYRENEIGPHSGYYELYRKQKDNTQ